MSIKSTETSFVDSLLTLKAQYEHDLSTVNAKVAHYREQLSHINALLLDQVLFPKEPSTLQVPPKQSGALALAHPSDRLQQNQPLLTATSGTTDLVKLPVELAQAVLPQRKASQRLKGHSKARKSSVLKAASGRNSLPLLPAYGGMRKLEAIRKVLEDNRGKVLHIDTISQTLFGTLNPQELRAERLRMKTALFQGSKKGLWQKVPHPPSSYSLELTPTSANTLGNTEVNTGDLKAAKGRTKSVSKPPRAAVNAIADRASANQIRRKTQGARILLPLKPDYEGLSKIDAVSQVMQENAGGPVHVETLIEKLFGELSLKEYKSEKTRMKDVMNRGRERGLWRKADAPLSFIAVGSNSTAVFPGATTTQPQPIKTTRRKKR